MTNFALSEALEIFQIYSWLRTVTSQLIQKSLSRLNHRLPGREAHPQVM